MTDPSFPVLEIKAFVDATTVVLTGPHADRVTEGTELYVLGIGNVTIPGTDVPLVVPKARLEVTLSADLYVVARTPLETVQVPGLAASFADIGSLGSRTVERRRELTKDEKQFLGNPGRRGVNVGDVVVRVNDVGDYVKWHVENRAAGSS